MYHLSSIKWLTMGHFLATHKKVVNSMVFIASSSAAGITVLLIKKEIPTLTTQKAKVYN
jgi:hypothetical protein